MLVISADRKSVQIIAAAGAYSEENWMHQCQQCGNVCHACSQPLGFDNQLCCNHDRDDSLDLGKEQWKNFQLRADIERFNDPL